jgi:hypothetical protein
VRADLPSREPRRQAATATPVAAPQVKADPEAGFEPAPGLPDLRDFIRRRRAALAGFMEQGAALRMAMDTVFVTPRNDIYVRYLSDNRSAIADLASELYGRKIKVELETPGVVGAPAAPAAGDSALPADSGPIHAAPDDPGRAGSGAVSSVMPAPDAALGHDAVIQDQATSTESADATGERARSNSDLRQALYADPVVRRIFNEFEARLVEVRNAPGAETNRPARSRKPNDP